MARARARLVPRRERNRLSHQAKPRRDRCSSKNTNSWRRYRRFLRAIHAGAVHFKHSDVLLANYGRLGPSFDLCTKVTIDVPRKEGMYNHDGDMVVEVKYDSLQRTLAPPDDARLQSVSLVMDVAVKDEERMAGLAKQLAVVRRPDSRVVTLSSRGCAGGHEGINVYARGGWE
jgi:hypothetical protein